MAVCAHRLFGWLPQPLARPLSMGMGVSHLRQRRTIDHAELSIRAKTAGVKTQCHVERSETSRMIVFVWPAATIRDSSLRSE